MERQAQALADQALDKRRSTPDGQRVLIAMGGIPGSGKTTLAKAVHRLLDARVPTAYVPMDGFHRPRAALQAMPDPEHALFRRGAPFTFDAPAFCELVKRVYASPTREGPTGSIRRQATRRQATRQQDLGGSGGGETTSERQDSPEEEEQKEEEEDDESTIYVPSFDHALQDPVERGLVVRPDHAIVLLEGNYVLLDEAPWSAVRGLYHLRWFVHVADLGVAEARLVARHLAAGITTDPHMARRMARDNDLVNAKEILRKIGPVDVEITSIHDPTWAQQA